MPNGILNEANGTYLSPLSKAYQAPFYLAANNGGTEGTAFYGVKLWKDVEKTIQMALNGQPQGSCFTLYGNADNINMFAACLNSVTTNVPTTVNSTLKTTGTYTPAGGITYPLQVVTASATLTWANSIVIAQDTATLTMPTCGAASLGQSIQIVSTDSGQTITLVPAFGQNIFGAAGALSNALPMTGAGSITMFCENSIGSYQLRAMSTPLPLGIASFGALGNGVMSITPTATSNNQTGFFTLVIGTTISATQNLGTLTLSAGQLNAINACAAIPQSDTDATTGSAIYFQPPSGKMAVLRYSGTSLAAGLYTYGYHCQ